MSWQTRRSHRGLEYRPSVNQALKEKTKNEDVIENGRPSLRPAAYSIALRARWRGTDAPVGTTDFPYVTRARERHIVYSGLSTCYRCGQPGHIKADCPTRGSKKSPTAAPSKGAPQPNNQIPPRRPAEEIADATVWADKIREHDPRMGENTCRMSDDIIDTPFRKLYGFGRTHGCVLRRLAARQLEELAEEKRVRA